MEKYIGKSRHGFSAEEFVVNRTDLSRGGRDFLELHPQVKLHRVDAVDEIAVAAGWDTEGCVVGQGAGRVGIGSGACGSRIGVCAGVDAANIQVICEIERLSEQLELCLVGYVEALGETKIQDLGSGLLEEVPGKAGNAVRTACAVDGGAKRSKA